MGAAEGNEISCRKSESKLSLPYEEFAFRMVSIVTAVPALLTPRTKREEKSFARFAV
jgi:hypothetical protein